VAKQWEKQKVDLAAEEQVKDGQAEDARLRGYRIFEELRPYPSVMYMERVRDSAV